MEYNFKAFILGHSRDSFSTFVPKPYLQAVNLNELHLPIPNTNHLAENRFYLLDERKLLGCPDYIGTLTSSMNYKYPAAVSLEDLDFIEQTLAPHVVYAARPTQVMVPNWVDFSKEVHPNMDKYLTALSEAMGISLRNSPAFWSNNFICHKPVFLDFLQAFQKGFYKLHARFGYKMDFVCADYGRRPAYLYERAAMLYFSRRNDLTIKPLPSVLDQFYVFACSSENYRPLTNLWYDSLIKAGFQPHNVKHIWFDLPKNLSSDVRFQSKEYSYCIERKTHYILQMLKEYRSKPPKHRYIVMSDCDIRFFPERHLSWQHFIRWIKEQKADIYYPYEWHNKEGLPVMNTGFFIVPVSSLDKAIAFYDWLHHEVVAAIDRYDTTELFKILPFMEQSLVNKDTTRIKKCMIPPEWHIQGRNYRPENRNSVLFHHAIDTKTLEEKIQQMNQINTYVQG